MHKKPKLGRVLAACYDVWQSGEGQICYRWVRVRHADRYGSDFHQTCLAKLRDMGFLQDSALVRGGARRYYTLADPTRVAGVVARLPL